MRKGDWMQTYSGVEFYPLDPRPEEIRIEDIAHALARLCRYGGHCIKFYSVAEHCCHISDCAPDEWKLEALMHDASEAYIVDVPRPIKPHLKDYAPVEDRLMQTIATKFRLTWPTPGVVKKLDNAILADERDQNMVRSPRDWGLAEPALGVKLQFWTPHKASYEFMARFHRFGGHL